MGGRFSRFSIWCVSRSGRNLNRGSAPLRSRLCLACEISIFLDLRPFEKPRVSGVHRNSVKLIGMICAVAGIALAASSQIVITVPRSEFAENLKASDVSVLRDKSPVDVVGLERLSGNLADMQLFILLDDSTRSSSLGVHLNEMKMFLDALPASTQVAVGYMRNGTFGLAQGFTTDHEKAASALRLPAAIPGENGSPYFVLSDLAKHWPSKDATDRRVVLMLTDGVDRYYTSANMDDPYVDGTVSDALRAGVMVYSIYLRGAGLNGQSSWGTNVAQSHLIQVTEETGGYAYFQALTDPVSIAPFLSDFAERLENQYRVTLGSLNRKGLQPLTIRAVQPGVKIEGPTRMYAR